MIAEVEQPIETGSSFVEATVPTLGDATGVVVSKLPELPVLAERVIDPQPAPLAVPPEDFRLDLGVQPEKAGSAQQDDVAQRIAESENAAAALQVTRRQLDHLKAVDVGLDGLRSNRTTAFRQWLADLSAARTLLTRIDVRAVLATKTTVMRQSLFALEAARARLAEGRRDLDRAFTRGQKQLARHQQARERRNATESLASTRAQLSRVLPVAASLHGVLTDRMTTIREHALRLTASRQVLEALAPCNVVAARIADLHWGLRVLAEARAPLADSRKRLDDKLGSAREAVEAASEKLKDLQLGGSVTNALLDQTASLNRQLSQLNALADRAAGITAELRRKNEDADLQRRRAAATERARDSVRAEPAKAPISEQKKSPDEAAMSPPMMPSASLLNWLAAKMGVARRARNDFAASPETRPDAKPISGRVVLPSYPLPPPQPGAVAMAIARDSAGLENTALAGVACALSGKDSLYRKSIVTII